MLDVALFGGTFDPIHIGHLRGIIEAKELCGISKVLVVPAGNPPHKLIEEHSPPEARLEMVRLAVRDLPGVDVSDIELKKEGISYTIETVEEIEKALPGERIGIIIGSDSLLEFSTWYRFEDILGKADILVIPRPGFLDEFRPEMVERAIIPVKITGIVQGSPHEECTSMTTDRGKSIILMSVKRINVSATGIREKVRTGKSIKFLVPQAVERYIIEEKLYRR